ncbi:unnamed protein product [Cyprideis torosa]|uniref:Uncharacterized protein n=1 Tax=Cyprideis torosa TaxID=163714 RepID=A0A7R8ZML4_9CRUS|nr:unnamed protein product [Cyprideis torosa]CAG0884606.1 unnamed protein product [Cyprideis torosa]
MSVWRALKWWSRGIRRIISHHQEERLSRAEMAPTPSAKIESRETGASLHGWGYALSGDTPVQEDAFLPEGEAEDELLSIPRVSDLDVAHRLELVVRSAVSVLIWRKTAGGGC